MTSRDDPGRSVARLNAINTIGALAGAVGLTMIGIPMLGSTHAQQVLVVAAGCSAALLVMRTPGGLMSTAALVAATSIATWGPNISTATKVRMKDGAMMVRSFAA